jgi:arylsulfatase
VPADIYRRPTAHTGLGARGGVGITCTWGSGALGTVITVAGDGGPRGNAFNGRVKGVQIAIADAAENSAHLVSPEDALRIAMARQ